LIDSVFSAVDECVVGLEGVLGLSSLEEEDNNTCITTTINHKNLSQILIINSSLLNSLGVGHPTLSEINRLTSTDFGLPTKLTGAGGGGCAFTILPPEVTKEKVEEIIKTIKELNEDYEVFESVLGGEGVRVEEEDEV